MRGFGSGGNKGDAVLAHGFIDGRHIGNGVPGSVITKLKNANVIRAVGVLVAGKFYADSEKSCRGDAKTRAVDKYELCSRALAEEFLRRRSSAGSW